MAVVERGASASGTACITDSAIVKIGSENGVIVVLGRALAGAHRLRHEQIVAKVAFITVCGIDGALQTLGIAGDALVGEHGGDELAIRAGGVACVRV